MPPDPAEEGSGPDVERRLRRRLGRERAARLEAEAIAERYTRDATLDPLTGLANRAQLLERLDLVLVRATAQGRGSRTGLLFLDVDDFKKVNDSSGHATGDEYLRHVARRLSGAARSSDLVARLGGDEFVILCEYVATATELHRLAARVRAALARPCDIGGQRFSMSASIGIRLAVPGETAGVVLRDADAAMYAAKAAGRATSVLFDPAEPPRTGGGVTSALGDELADAVRTGALSVAYQPVVGLPAGDVLGVEALVRWDHLERGQVPPSEFIPLAEASGLVVEIDRQVLREACRQVSSWNSAPTSLLALSVNATIETLEDPAYVRDVARVLRGTGLSPRCLTVEITERSLASDSPVLEENLASLRAMGVSLAIDDFGVEYSSFSYLRRLPVDVLKIDRSFVCGVGASARDEALVAAMVGVARALGMRTVAEGVETQTQAQALSGLGVDAAQGWFYARARSAQEWSGPDGGAPTVAVTWQADPDEAQRLLAADGHRVRAHLRALPGGGPGRRRPR